MSFRRAVGIGTMLACGLAESAVGQAINVDFGLGFGQNLAPSFAYGGAAGQSGFWNATGGLQLDTAGMLSSVLISRSGVQSGTVNSIPGTTPDELELMKDVWTGSGDLSKPRASISITGLEAGQYRFFVYGWSSLGSSQTFSDYDVSLNGGAYLHSRLSFTNTWHGQVEGETFFQRSPSLIPRMRSRSSCRTTAPSSFPRAASSMGCKSCLCPRRAGPGSWALPPCWDCGGSDRHGFPPSANGHRGGTRSFPDPRDESVRCGGE